MSKDSMGGAAVYLINLRYDRTQDDYVELKERDIFIRDYYCKYLKVYLDNHNGLRYSKLSTEQKELDFIAEHEVIIRGLWERSTPLTKYPVLFEYAKNAEKDYETYLANRKKEIQKKVIEPGTIFDEKNSKNRTFSHQKMAFFTSFCTAYFDIQEITLTFTSQNGGTSREWC